MALALMLAALPCAAAAQCQLCQAPTDVATRAAGPARALSIEVETTLDFARAAHDGRGSGGSIAIDPRTGAREVRGLIDLGGTALRGTIRLRGVPNARVGLSLPHRVTLAAPDGSLAEVIAIRADLPPDPQLNANGELEVAFGGRLQVKADAAGDFRGRISVTADYR